MAEEKLGRILVVDDEADIRMISEAVLRKKGYEVVTVNDGEQALETYQRGNFSALLTDFNMPRMNGDELTRKVKKDNPNFPVVLYTGKRDNVKLAEEAGADYVLEKPFENSALVEAVEKAISGKKEE